MTAQLTDHMKRFCSVFFLVCFAYVFLSWGSLGHRAVGLIAQRHLSDKAKAGVTALLGSTTLADVSTWADEVRGQEEYKSTGPWHYINLPVGLSREAFEEKVYDMRTPNVYSALSTAEQTLYNPNAPKQDKVIALKFIVHFIGDLHQPMHVSRAEDQGGNKVQVNFDGTGTNLHSLWDSKLLEQEGLSDQQLAEKLDHRSAAQLKTWQTDPLLTWLWESYQISSTLYKEIEAMPKRSIGVEYYRTHIGIAEERLEKAGVRLAGVLNMIFAGGSVDGRIIPPPPPAAMEEPAKPQPKPSQQMKAGAVKEVPLSEVAKHEGEEVKVCGKVYGEKALSGMTLVNLGAAYPNQLLTVVLKGEAKSNWKGGEGRSLCVTGKVVIYKSKPEIQVISSEDIGWQK